MSSITNINYGIYIYITGFIGFILAFILFMIARSVLSRVHGLIGSIILLIIGTCCYLIKFNFMFYVAVGLTTFAYAIMIPSINIINNDIAKRNQEVLGNKLALAITLLTIIQSFARFVGPMMFTIFGTSDYSSTCNFTDVDKYITEGCTINHYYLMNGIYIGISAVLMLGSSIIIFRKEFQRYKFLSG